MPINPAEIKRTSRWQWLPLGHVTQFDIRVTITTEQIRDLTGFLLTQLLPQETRSQPTVTDFRGRDPMRDSLIESSALPALRAEELFFISARRAPEEVEEEVGLAPEPIEISFTTRFHSFEGSKHIKFAVDRRRQGTSEDSTSDLETIVDPTVEILAARLGVEFFEARFLSIFGFSPIPTKTLQIEIAEGQLALRIISEGMKSKDDRLLPEESCKKIVTLLATLGISDPFRAGPLK